MITSYFRPSCVFVVSIGCASLLSGCGTGLFGPKLYTVPTNGAVADAASSPLPPLKLDAKYAKPKETVLYGRVVIDGKPAKKGSVTVFAVDAEVLQDAEELLRLIPGTVKKGGPPKKPSYRPVSSTVMTDDGLYLIKGVRQGEYKIYCLPGPSLSALKPQLTEYTSPVTSPWTIQVEKMQQNMQDLVLIPKSAE